MFFKTLIKSFKGLPPFFGGNSLILKQINHFMLTFYEIYYRSLNNIVDIII